MQQPEVFEAAVLDVIQNQQKAVFCAPTGAGKTAISLATDAQETFQSKVHSIRQLAHQAGKTIFYLAPYQSIVSQQGQADDSLEYICSGGVTAEQADLSKDMITTYESFGRLLNRLKTHYPLEEIFAKYVFVIDEMHELVHTTFLSQSAVKSVINHCGFIGFTATPNEVRYFCKAYHAQLHYLENISRPLRKLYVKRSKNEKRAKQQAISRILRKEKGKTIMLHQQNKNLNRALAKTHKGFAYDANDKEDKKLRQILISSTLPESMPSLFTSFARAGLNLHNVDIAIAITKDRIPSNTEQELARARGYDHKRIVILPEWEANDETLNIETFRADKIAEAEGIAENFNKLKNVTQQRPDLAAGIVSTLEYPNWSDKENLVFYDVIADDYQVDYARIEHLCMLKRASQRTPEDFLEELAQIGGYEICPLEALEEDSENENDEELMENIEAQEEERKVVRRCIAEASENLEFNKALSEFVGTESHDDKLRQDADLLAMDYVAEGHHQEGEELLENRMLEVVNINHYQNEVAEAEADLEAYRTQCQSRRSDHLITARAQKLQKAQKRYEIAQELMRLSYKEFFKAYQQEVEGYAKRVMSQYQTFNYQKPLKKCRATAVGKNYNTEFKAEKIVAAVYLHDKGVAAATGRSKLRKKEAAAYHALKTLVGTRRKLNPRELLKEISQIEALCHINSLQALHSRLIYLFRIKTIGLEWKLSERKLSDILPVESYLAQYQLLIRHKKRKNVS
jgi:hypothetical protein